MVAFRLVLFDAPGFGGPGRSFTAGVAIFPYEKPLKRLSECYLLTLHSPLVPLPSREGIWVSDSLLKLITMMPYNAPQYMIATKKIGSTKQLL